MARKRRLIEDLSEYEDCEDAERFGMYPMAIGFIQYKQSFAVLPPSYDVDHEAVQQVLPFCHSANRVAALPQAMPCPLCNQRIEMEIDGEMVRLGSAEIRVIGEHNIYAAPDLLPHYMTAHRYMPPNEFLEALDEGSGVNSAEFRALHNALN